ncbi:MAG: UDP-N-acetylmuramoyl-L-alanyl-D-glutamate--2,6-diaminopimelate ligase [Acidobacteriota bacterium]
MFHYRKKGKRRRENTIKLQQLIKGIGVQNVRGDLSIEIRGISYDSRNIGAGFLFVALKGFKLDGAYFVNEAIAAGAAAVLSWRDIHLLPDNIPLVVVRDEREALAVTSRNFYEKPDEKIRVIGVTGTNGKTTICYFLESILFASGNSSGVLGTVTRRMGDEIAPSERTTPESSDIFAFMSRLHEKGFGYCVMEVSSHAIALKRVHGMKFRQLIFTNLTQDHLDFHGTLEDYFRTKSLAFQELPDGSDSIVNIDSEWGKSMISISKGRISTYGLSDDSDFRIRVEGMSFTGSRFAVRFQGKEHQLFSPIIGIPNIYNATAAFAAALLLGLEPEAIREGIVKCRHIPGRFEKIEEGQDFTLLIDYAHTDDALENLLISLREIMEARLITVFGCGGDRDRLKRPKMGAVAARLSDFVIITSDNPRSEDPEAIISEIETGIATVGGSSSKYITITDRAEAIEEAIMMAQKGDIVVIAGKGHEKYQQIGDTLIPFEDKKVAAQLIRKKMGVRVQNVST